MTTATSRRMLFWAYSATLTSSAAALMVKVTDSHSYQLTDNVQTGVNYFLDEKAVSDVDRDAELR